MTRSDYFRPVRGGISGLCEEADDKSICINRRKVSEPGAKQYQRRNHTYRNNHTPLRPIYSGHTLSTWFGCRTVRVKQFAIAL